MLTKTVCNAKAQLLAISFMYLKHFITGPGKGVYSSCCRLHRDILLWLSIVSELIGPLFWIEAQRARHMQACVVHVVQKHYLFFG